MQKKGSSLLRKLGGIVLGLGVGIAMGVVLIGSIGLDEISRMDAPTFARTYGLLILGMVVAFFLQIIVHEAGHLVFGLATGYGFSSFRIASLVLQKTPDGLALKRMSVPGTLGQCLMSPPTPRDDGSFPVTLYNLGGIIANLVLSLVAVCVVLLVRPGSLATGFLWSVVVIGIALALTNGIPTGRGVVPNDGWNAINLQKDELARRSFWVQLAAGRLQAEGTRMRDLPAEWFDLPDGPLEGPFATGLALFAESRLLDQHDLAGARKIARQVVDPAAEAPGVYVPVALCDLLFCDLVLDGDADVSVLEEREVKALLGQMESMPSVIRTRYAIAKVKHGDEAEAAACLERFEKAALAYPVQTDIETERELIALVGTD